MINAQFIAGLVALSSFAFCFSISQKKENKIIEPQNPTKGLFLCLCRPAPLITAETRDSGFRNASSVTIRTLGRQRKETLTRASFGICIALVLGRWHTEGSWRWLIVRLVCCVDHWGCGRYGIAIHSTHSTLLIRVVRCVLGVGWIRWMRWIRWVLLVLWHVLRIRIIWRWLLLSIQRMACRKMLLLLMLPVCCLRRIVSSWWLKVLILLGHRARTTHGGTRQWQRRRCGRERHRLACPLIAAMFPLTFALSLAQRR